MIVVGLYPAPFDFQLRHDFSATVISNGQIYAYEESKLSSLKNENTSLFSERSMLLGFKELGILPNDVDLIALPKPFVEPPIESLKALYWDTFKFNSSNDQSFEGWMSKCIYVKHHEAHVSMSILSSGWSEAAFLSMDGGGDWGDSRNFVFGEFKNGKQSVLADSFGLNTIASFHAFLTDAIGFSGGDNGKTSGLAGYGEVRKDLQVKLETLLERKGFEIWFNRKRFQRSSVNLDKVNPSSYDRSKSLNRTPSDTNLNKIVLEYLPQDIAATGEFVIQKWIISLLRELRRLTKLERIVLSGGLFQNVALNSAILNSEIFKDVHVPMAPSDAGLSLGLAWSALQQEEIKVGKVKPLKPENLSPYLGPSFSTEYVQNLLNDYRIQYSILEDIPTEVAKLLTEGAVVGWFQGRAEYGPRSLGSRSILADPRDINSKARVNQLLKKRDWFMPYAPSILEEYMSGWISESKFSPYMQFALHVKKEMIMKIPAAVHVDGTSRVHTVRKEWNPLYWNLINEFRKLTGVPLVLNTSFNRHGISTISTPKQAIEHLLSGSMDFLVIDKFLVSFVENRVVKQDVFPLLTSERDLLLEMIEKRYEYVKSVGNGIQVDNYSKNKVEFQNNSLVQ